MGEILVDENGNAVDQEGKQGKSYNADSLTKADILSIVSNYNASLRAIADGLSDVADGSSYDNGKKALEDLIAIVTGGPHLEFYRANNGWMNNQSERAKYLTCGGEGIGDKQVIVDFFDLVKVMVPFRTDLVGLAKVLLGSTLLTAYKAIRFSAKMEKLVEDVNLQRVRMSFAEFGVIYQTMNNSAIFDVIPVNKTRYTSDENKQMILDYINREIAKKPNLSHYLISATEKNSAGDNEVRLLSKETKVFDSIACREDTLKRASEMCDELDAKLMGYYAMANDQLFAYLDCYKQVLEQIVMTLGNARDEINMFREKKTTEPYSVMHYDPLVVECSNQFSLGYISDPLVQGTSYQTMYKDMPARLQSLVANIAKLAPS